MSQWSELHTTVFLLRIRPGRVDEYRRRHAEIWPELVSAQRESGIVHFDIYLHERTLEVFGHVLRTRAPDPSAPENPVMVRWRQHMADVLEMDGERPAQEKLERVYHMTV